MLITQAIGNFGRWQLMLTFLLSLCNIPSVFHVFVPTFHLRTLDTWCARPENFSQVDSKQWRHKTQPDGDYCKIISSEDLRLVNKELVVKENYSTVECTDWEFDGEGTTLITEFLLVCSKKYLIQTSELSFLGGIVIGGLVSGVLSDRFGRKKTVIGSVLCQTIVGISIAFNPWFELYVVLRAILGLLSSSLVFSALVLCLELIDGIWRIVTGIATSLPGSICYGIVSAIAYFIRDWRTLQLVISVPGACLLSYWWIVPESPRWLLAMGKTKEVIHVLEKGAKFNKRILPPTFRKDILAYSNTVDTEALGVTDLFRTQRLRKITICLFVAWFSFFFIYYGLTLNLGNIGGDLYLNSALIGIVEMPALVLSMIIFCKMGRRWPMACTAFFSGCFCFATIPVPFLMDDPQWLLTTFTMCGKFLIAPAYSMIPIFTAELYPIKIRNIGVGANNIPAGIALILTPYIWNLADFHAYLPMAVLGVVGWIGGIVILMLPEPASSQLRTHVHNIENGSIKSGRRVQVHSCEHNSPTPLSSVSTIA